MITPITTKLRRTFAPKPVEDLLVWTLQNATSSENTITFTPDGITDSIASLPIDIIIETTVRFTYTVLQNTITGSAFFFIPSGSITGNPEFISSDIGTHSYDLEVVNNNDFILMGDKVMESGILEFSVDSIYYVVDGTPTTQITWNI
ncbi:unnamed protein product [marine sediment metagenome]|uniref:Uncharacterized protein n=1 Tax=marine sediment metagenome TaxID=412755 RepID=X0RLP8_9ZZZZ